MINVLINGCNGQMGKEIVNRALKKNNITIVAGFDILDLGDNNFPVYSNLENITEPIDVIIDFSTPVATMNILEFAKNKKIPIVIATTGLSDEEFKKINEYSEIIPIFMSANMSMGINVMIELINKAVQILNNEYDIEIVEKHHRNKIDAPSGTALLLADSLNECLKNKYKYIYNRNEIHNKRDENEIGIQSIRGGNLIGEHTVLFMGENETLEITHCVQSRSVFADGALKAAEYLIYQSPGIYSMKNLI